MQKNPAFSPSPTTARSCRFMILDRKLSSFGDGQTCRVILLAHRYLTFTLSVLMLRHDFLGTKQAVTKSR